MYNYMMILLSHDVDDLNRLMKSEFAYFGPVMIPSEVQSCTDEGLFFLGSLNSDNSKEQIISLCRDLTKERVPYIQFGVLRLKNNTTDIYTFQEGGLSVEAGGLNESLEKAMLRVYGNNLNSVSKMGANRPVPEQSELVSKIRDWLRRTPFTDFCSAISQRVIGQKNLTMFLTCVYTYLQQITSGRNNNKNNILLSAPSGSGKTETYRALREYFRKEIPGFVISLVDMNQITQEGFRGKDTKFVIEDLINEQTGGIGIVFMDEFDKKILPTYTQYGENVNANIQSQLLMMIEGVIMEGVDTSKTLFVGMGSFDGFRETRKNEKTYGFGADRESNEVKHYSPITREEMIAYGGSYELIGRFSTLINYGVLSDEAVDQIIDLRLKEIGEDFGYQLRINEDMRKLLHDNSNTRFGNRLIDSIIREKVLKAKTIILTKNIEGVTGITISPNKVWFIMGNSREKG